MQVLQNNLSTGGSVSRLMAAFCYARPGKGGIIGQFLDVDSLAGGPLDAPDVMPAGSTYRQKSTKMVSSTGVFR